MDAELVLRGVFVHLVKHGFRLGVRDYLDALRSLRGGHGGHGRRELLWLCQALWARTEAERRTVALLFDRIPLPTDEEVGALTGAPPVEREPGEPLPLPHPAPDGPAAPAGGRETAIGVTFAPPRRDEMGVPGAGAGPGLGELFILTPRPVVPTRALVIAWRRFRAALRTGPRVELDLDSTVAAKCRTGLLDQLVLVPARRNRARMVLLVDASASMQPWQRFNEALEASLRQGQLGDWALFYFDDVPDVLYRDPRLLNPVSVEHALRAHPWSTLLVVSDAGAARGGGGRSRLEATRRALAALHPAWRPIAWLNPMPRERWKGSAADEISRLRGVSMLELSEDGVVKAVDVLRGRTVC